MRLVKWVPENEQIPAFFGVAWCDFYRYRRLCLPIPFNALAAVGYIVYRFLKCPFYGLLQKAAKWTPAQGRDRLD